ncbi:hypothetical protein D3C78_849620 [compost metagenome]
MSAIRPSSTSVAVPLPPTVTLLVVPVSDRVPWVTVRVTWIARPLTSGSRSASMSLTRMPGIASGTSSRPLCSPGRLLTGASLSSTYPELACAVLPSPRVTPTWPSVPASVSMRRRNSPNWAMLLTVVGASRRYRPEGNTPNVKRPLLSVVVLKVLSSALPRMPSVPAQIRLIVWLGTASS